MLRRSDMPAMRTRFPFRITARILRFFACGDRCVVVRPIAPRAGIEAAIRDAGQLHREEVVRGVHSRAAIHDRSVLSTEAGEPGAQGSGRFETTVGSEVLAE